MLYQWDSANTGHIAEHDIAPEEAEQVIENDPYHLQRQIRNGEERTLYLGETAAGRVLFVVVTPRGELLRVVTAYPANRKERTLYLLRREAEYEQGD